MAGKDMIEMSTRDLKRLTVIRQAIDKLITQRSAAETLKLCDRQIRRIIQRIKSEGNAGVIHKSRGKPSNRRKPPHVKDKVLQLCKRRYRSFGPTFASEKLFEIDKISVHPETLRLWFIEENIQYKKRRAPKHRSWRPRKEAFGQMVQMDGSHHKWFEDRAPECVLMGYIDDATGRIFGKFYEYEGTFPAMDSFARYIRRYGIPQALYLDKHTTYKSNKKETVEDELNNTKSLSEFERAAKELGVDIIHADSPQAKGRIERSFNTHQDRLVKELKLRGIASIKEANRYLMSDYIPNHNRRFSVPAQTRANVHRRLPSGVNLQRIFCTKKEAALRNDFTVKYEHKFYQILDTMRSKKVTVEKLLNGKIFITHKGKNLDYKLIEKQEKPKRRYEPRKTYIPPKDHAWRRFSYGRLSTYQHC